ncbi:MAG: hypothetical protein ACXVYB_00975 [Arthrobacter sp.]
MRLYHAICTWIEAAAFEKLAGSAEEPRAEGNNFAHIEHAHSFTTEPELHAGWRPSDVDWDDRAHISLRWSPSSPDSPDSPTFTP